MREWRKSVLPRYHALVEAREAQVDSEDPTEFVRLADDIAGATDD